MATCDEPHTPVQVLANLLKCPDCCRQIATPLIQFPDMTFYFCSVCIRNSRNYLYRCMPERKRDLLIERLCFSTILKCSYSTSGCPFTGTTILEVATHEKCCRFSSQPDINNENWDYTKTAENNSIALEEDCTVMEGPQGQTLDEALSAEMNCPVCTTRIPLPIRECENGHLICDKCFHRLEMCPVCRGSKSPTSSPVLELIYISILVPCRNVRNGCKIREGVLSIEDHEESCDFNEASCPLIENGRCRWQGLRSGVLDHWKACHSEDLRLGPRSSEVFESGEDPSYKFLYVDGIFFRYRWIESDGSLYFFINYLGDETGYRYFYQVELTCRNNRYSRKVARSNECFRGSGTATGDFYLRVRPLRGVSSPDDCSINYVLTVQRGIRKNS